MAPRIEIFHSSAAQPSGTARRVPQSSDTVFQLPGVNPTAARYITPHARQRLRERALPGGTASISDPDLCRLVAREARSAIADGAVRHAKEMREPITLVRLSKEFGNVVAIIKINDRALETGYPEVVVTVLTEDMALRAIRCGKWKLLKTSALQVAA